jgi:hypothetical protein
MPIEGFRLAPLWRSASVLSLPSSVVTNPSADPSTAGSLPGQAGAEDALVTQLALASRDFDATGRDLERNCWMAVHRHVHGVLPSEYDIREVPEALYLAVLAARRAQG